MKHNTKISIILFTVVAIVIFFGISMMFSNNDDDNKEGNNVETQNADEQNITIEYKNSTVPTQNLASVRENIKNEFNGGENVIFPPEKLLDVQFIPQAPFHDWEEPWQNACEEAAVLNSYYYLEGRKNISNDQIRDDIQAMIDWEKTYFGSHKDLNIYEVSEIIERYLGYEYKIIKINSIEDIKLEISNGNSVVIPAAGRILENEHFTQPAPIYHMLTVIGYTQDKIITNDPGTQFGKKMEYSYENIMASIHDWVEGANEKPDLMLKGKKVGVVLK